MDMFSQCVKERFPRFSSLAGTKYRLCSEIPHSLLDKLDM